MSVRYTAVPCSDIAAGSRKQLSDYLQLQFANRTRQSNYSEFELCVVNSDNAADTTDVTLQDVTEVECCYLTTEVCLNRECAVCQSRSGDDL